MRALALVVLLACLSGCLFGCKEKTEQTSTNPPAAEKDPLLGEWVASVGDADGNDTLVIRDDGTVLMSPVGEAPVTFNYKVESPKDWIKRRGLDSVPFGDKGVTSIVTMTQPGQEGEVPFYYYADLQLLLLPFTGPVYVRPGREKRTSLRKDAGDGSHAPLDFLKPFEPIFADSKTGDWAYTFQGDWRKVLPEAAREVRAAGFDGPPVEKEEAGLRGETGSVIYYRSLDSEKVLLAPNLRSEWKDGKWVTREEKGWITVHVNIKAAP